MLHHLRSGILALVLLGLPLTTGWAQKSSGRHPAQNSTPQLRLNEPTDFIPADKDPLDQLLEVARHFQLPMGIEWVDDPAAVYAPLSLPPSYTVHDLLASIVQRAPGYELFINRRIVNVRSASHSDNRLNLLSMRLRRFRVANETLLDAQQELWLAIEWSLHPERFANGYEGGWGNDPTDVFALKNINLSIVDLPIREILDRLVQAYGQTLWVAHLQPDILNGKAGPTLASIYPGKESLVSLWEFVSLRREVKDRTGAAPSRVRTASVSDRIRKNV